MRIIAERTLEIDEELCVCFIDWQKAFDRVNWTKVMQILKRTGIDWRERSNYVNGSGGDSGGGLKVSIVKSVYITYLFFLRS